MNIAVLVSGGVDSSVVLRMLHEEGHQITAVYLKIWLEDELSYLGDCPWEDDLGCVRAVCAQIGVPLEIVPLQREYSEAVVSYVLEQVRQGFTPNPDVLCNQQVKFGAFYRVLGHQFERCATGHYAQLRQEDGYTQLYRAVDPIKDQSYFLSMLSQEQLSRALFPIGHLMKSEVRARAVEYGIPNALRKDSQGICFLGKISFAEFLEHHLGTKEGVLREYETGAMLGKHRGFWFYTIGQRQGIGLSGGPWYVVAKNVDENIVYVSRAYHELTEERDHCIIGPVHWIAEPLSAQEPVAVQVKLRHGPQLHDARIQACSDRPDRYELRLERPDQGIASGQFAVLYQGERCVGAGRMEQPLVRKGRQL